MGLKINGSTSGSIEIDVPAVAGTDTSITIPAKNGGTFIVEESTGNIDLGPLDINGSASDDSVNIDGSGRLLVGTSSARTNAPGGTEGLLLEGTSSTNSQNRFAQFFYGEAGTAGPYIGLAKHRSTSIGGNTIVNNGDELGGIYFQGADGSDFRQGASISAFVDSTPGVSDMPGRLAFSTTADGASLPTERMRIDRNGALNCYHNTYGAQFRTNAAAGTTYELMYLTYGATNVTNGTNCLRVYTNGNVQNTNNSYGGFSDIKLKENIVDASSQWDDIKALQIRKYNFKEETGLPTHTQLGIVAQEVELISPGLVTESPERGDVQIPVLDEDGNAVLDENGDQVFNTEIRDLGTTIKSVNYSVLYMKAVKALQEAMERIETLETANASLEARLTALEGGAS